MIRPSEVLKPLGMSVLEEVRATAAAGVVILLAAALCRAVEDRIEARAEARAAAIQAEADASDEVWNPEDLVGQCVKCDSLTHETSEHPGLRDPICKCCNAGTGKHSRGLCTACGHPAHPDREFCGA